MGNAGSTGTTSPEEERCSTIGMCLNKILAPNLRNKIAKVLQCTPEQLSSFIRYSVNSGELTKSLAFTEFDPLGL